MKRIPAVAVALVLAGAAGAAEANLPAFPGAEGWGSDTPGSALT